MSCTSTLKPSLKPRLEPKFDMTVETALETTIETNFHLRISPRSKKTLDRESGCQTTWEGVPVRYFDTKILLLTNLSVVKDTKHMCVRILAYCVQPASVKCRHFKTVEPCISQTPSPNHQKRLFCCMRTRMPKRFISHIFSTFECHDHDEDDDSDIEVGAV